jgi:hypothetical protein
MGVLFWPALVVGLLAGFMAGWAARQGDNAEYVQRRARWIAQHELAPRPRLAAWTDDVVDAELLYAASARLDRPEVTR